MGIIMRNNINFLEIIKYILKDDNTTLIFKKYIDENNFKGFKKEIKDFKCDETNKKFLKKIGFKKQNEELFDEFKKYFENLVVVESEEESEEEIVKEEKKEEIIESEEEIVKEESEEEIV